MKFSFFCPNCQQEDGHPLNSFFDASLNNDDISEYECPRGHKFVIVSRNDKYRVIFDESIMQLQYDFYNNAVLNAYT